MRAPNPLPGCFSVFLLALPLTLASCGPTVGTQTRIDYATEALRCDENERAIIAREGTSAEEDALAMAAERDRCNAALRGLLDGGVR